MEQTMITRATGAVMLGLTALLILFYGLFTKYAPANDNSLTYAFFQDVHVMVFLGFGFLMSFLHKAGFTATGHAYFIAAFAGLWAMPVVTFFHQGIKNGGPSFEKIELTTGSLIVGDFGAAAVLISFGAMLGRLSALQLIVMAFFEVLVYGLNESILVTQFKATDVGGSLLIHAFGAYFGLACSFMLEKANAKREEKSYDENKGSAVTDTMAMVGTLFLFCFWPSFNGAPAAALDKDRTVVNTYLSISCSCFVAFAVNAILRGKFRMVEIQNATIAGGVAVGATANLVIDPFGAMLIGSFAGAISVLGYQFLTPLLDEKVGLKDTCGVHNLHGMPGVVGALASLIAVAAADESDYAGGVFNFSRGKGNQVAHQLYSLLVTLALAIVGGSICGVALRFVPGLEKFFDDSQEYEVEEEEASGANEPTEMGSKKKEEAPKQVDGEY